MHHYCCCCYDLFVLLSHIRCCFWKLFHTGWNCGTQNCDIFCNFVHTCTQIPPASLKILSIGMLALIQKLQHWPANTCTVPLLKMNRQRQAVVLSVCKGLLFTGSLWILYWFNQAALWCCQAASSDGMSAATPQTVCLDCCSPLVFLSFLLCCKLYSFYITTFIILCLFLRPESSGDSAAFLSSSRSISGCALLAAAVWSQRSPAIGQQTRPHPVRHRSLTRTRTSLRAPHKVSAKLISLQHYIHTLYITYIKGCCISVTLYNIKTWHCGSYQFNIASKTVKQ